MALIGASAVAGHGKENGFSLFGLCPGIGFPHLSFYIVGDLIVY